MKRRERKSEGGGGREREIAKVEMRQIEIFSKTNKQKKTKTVHSAYDYSAKSTLRWL